MDGALQQSDVERIGPHDAVLPADVRAELARILSSPDFQASDRRRHFLQYVVEETLSGRAERLKGFSIAMSVFGRDETFDSQADPVVRLEARRLRRDLDSYYAHSGANDPVRIAIPKGSYVPSFEGMVRPPKNATEASDRPAQPSATALPGSDAAPTSRLRTGIPRWLLAALVAVAVLTGLVMGKMLIGSPNISAANEPAVMVLPFEAIGGDESTRYLAQGIRQELINDLFRFPGLRLYAVSTGHDVAAITGPAANASQLGVAYTVTGSVRSDPEQIRFATRVINAQSGQIIWSKTYTRPPDPQSLIRVQAELASEIATAIGQPYGIVANDIVTQRSGAGVSNMQSYLCVLRAYGYRRSFQRKDFDPVLRCLEQTVRRDPGYSDAWAMLGWLHVDAGRLGYSGEQNRQREYEEALRATTQAATLQPNSPLALKALAATYHYLARYEDSERIARQAAQLNPNDPEILAQLGWRLAVRGKFEEGIPILKRAIERTVNPPSWYFDLIAVDLYLKHDYADMLKISERAALGDPGFGQLLLAIANGQIGNRDETRQALEKMQSYEPVGANPEGFMRRHGATDEIVKAMLTGLEKARQVAAGR